MNGEIVKPSYLLEGSEKIDYRLPDLEHVQDSLIPQNLPLDILYEDDELIAVNKPAGLTVHPGVGKPDGTLVNALAFHFTTLSDINGLTRPGIIHRLDEDTSGVILVAKTNRAHGKIAEQFEHRSVEKTYEAVTWGIWDLTDGTIENPIKRKRSDPRTYTVALKGKTAITDYKVMYQGRYLSHLEFYPRTGRTHQIRVHAASLNHPIFADEKYGGGLARTKGFLPEVTRELKLNIKKIGRQALHAIKIVFTHPSSGEKMSLEAPRPQDFTTLIHSIKSADV